MKKERTTNRNRTSFDGVSSFDYDTIGSISSLKSSIKRYIVTMPKDLYSDCRSRKECLGLGGGHMNFLNITHSTKQGGKGVLSTERGCVCGE